MTPSVSGFEIIADLYGIDESLLIDEKYLNNLFSQALNDCGFTIIGKSSHKFTSGGKGVTGMFLLSESHATYHSYPEWNAIAINVFSCGQSNPEEVTDIISKALSPDKIKTKHLKRNFKPES